MSWINIRFRARTLAASLILLCLMAPLVVQKASANVELKYFDVIPGDGQVEIIWGTGTEFDIVGFYVERSDERNFEVSILVGDFFQEASGDVTGDDYSLTDTDVVNGTTYYYRLQVVYGATPPEYPVAPLPAIPSTATATPTVTSSPTQNNEPAETNTPTLMPTLTPSPIPATPTSTRTPTRTVSAAYPGPAPTNTRPPQTPTPAPTRPTTSVPPGQATVTPGTPGTPGAPGTPGTPGTPTQTATLVPLPDITLLFPVFTPTGTSSPVPTLTQAAALMSATVPGDEGGELRPRVALLGGAIVLVWALLGGFLFVYLRRVGH